MTDSVISFNGVTYLTITPEGKVIASENLTHKEETAYAIEIALSQYRRRTLGDENYVPEKDDKAIDNIRIIDQLKMTRFKLGYTGYVELEPGNLDPRPFIYRFNSKMTWPYPDGEIEESFTCVHGDGSILMVGDEQQCRTGLALAIDTFNVYIDHLVLGGSVLYRESDTRSMLHIQHNITKDVAVRIVKEMELALQRTKS